MLYIGWNVKFKKSMFDIWVTFFVIYMIFYHKIEFNWILTLSKSEPQDLLCNDSVYIFWYMKNENKLLG